MKCPHCLNNYHEDKSIYPQSNHTRFTYRKRGWRFRYEECPECGDLIADLILFNKATGESTIVPAFPKSPSRILLPKESLQEFYDDYYEASLVLNDSPKASAALSRRCLQNILREKAIIQIFNQTTGKYEEHHIKKGDLFDEIQQVIEYSGLPTGIKEGLDAVRNIGNFGAHPIKSKQTGEIVNVEPGEAEWNLDILESLFDYYFIQPLIVANKRKELNTKLSAVGKPPLK